MRARTDDRLIQEPRIRRVPRPRPGTARPGERAVPTPRMPARDERPEP